MNKQGMLYSGLALALILFLAVGLGYAQGPVPSGVEGPAPSGGHPQAPLGVGFTYQGRLRDSGGSPLTDTCDFRFGLWDSESGGSQVGGDSVVTGVEVVDGYFAAVVNSGGEFGASAFVGEARWLEVAVQCPGDADYVLLSPRQALTAAPYATYSQQSPWGGITAMPAGFADDIDDDILGGLSCASGQIAEWDGLSWVCGDDDAGGGDHDHWGETWTGTGTGLTLSGGDVGLHGSGGISGVHGESASSEGYGVYGYASATEGSNYGVYGRSASTWGHGVLAWAFAATGETYGVYARSDSSEGTAVYGWATASSGVTRGVYGHSSSTDGTGVRGFTSAFSGTTYGVYGLSLSTEGYGVYGSAPVYGVYGEATAEGGYGVYGYASNTTGNSIGVYGRSDSSAQGVGVVGTATSTEGITWGVIGSISSPSGIGVWGRANASSGATFGVYGESSSTEGHGVYGSATAASGATYGVYGKSGSPDGRGVYGEATASSGFAFGVTGESTSADGRGVYGYASSGSGGTIGVYGVSESSAGCGVYGRNYAATGTTYGVLGRAGSADGYGVYYIGGLGGTGLKTSVVETPDYGWRHLYTMESTGNWFEDFGTAQLVDGQAVVTIDPIFAQTVNLAESYHVFAMALCGEHVLLSITDKGLTEFTVQGVSLDGRPSSCAFDYRIVAKRQGYEDVRLTLAAPPPTMEFEVGGGE